jgi:hypothetical protein
MFYGKYPDKGNNPVDNPSIYNFEGDNRLSPSLQPLTTGIVLKILFFFQSSSVIVFSVPEINLLSSAKQNIQVINILE